MMSMRMSERDYKQLTLGITPKPRKDPFSLSEHELQTWCIDYLRKRGHFAQRINSGKIFVRDRDGKIIRVILMAETGTPDICGHHGRTGKAIYIECKIKPNKPKPEQLLFLETARLAGCIAEAIYNQEQLINIESL